VEEVGVVNGANGVPYAEMVDALHDLGLLVCRRRSRQRVKTRLRAMLAGGFRPQNERRGGDVERRGSR
jgi:hypothetical protein